MPQSRTKEQIYDKCLVDGNLIEIEEINKDKIIANLKIAQDYESGAKELLSKKISNLMFTAYYDTVHILVSTYLIFDKIKISIAP